MRTGLLLCALLAGNAHAASCEVSANDLEFGAYVSGQSTPLDANTTLRVRCENEGNAETLRYSLAISPSLDGSVQPRVLRDGSESLAYDLFTSGTRNQVWGDGLAAGLAPVGTLSLPGEAETEWIVFGRIFAQQTLPAGQYTDVLRVTIEY